MESYKHCEHSRHEYTYEIKLKSKENPNLDSIEIKCYSIAETNNFIIFYDNLYIPVATFNIDSVLFYKRVPSKY